MYQEDIRLKWKKILLYIRLGLYLNLSAPGSQKRHSLALLGNIELETCFCRFKE